MEAKDTVMNMQERELLYLKVGDPLETICQAQAEISFKAGIREVVEWVKHTATEPMAVKDSDKTQTMLIVAMPAEQWQAKLKEWNV